MLSLASNVTFGGVYSTVPMGTVTNSYVFIIRTFIYNTIVVGDINNSRRIVCKKKKFNCHSSLRQQSAKVIPEFSKHVDSGLRAFDDCSSAAGRSVLSIVCYLHYSYHSKILLP